MTGSFWDDKSSPIAIAHRGGDAAGEKKENTIEAFAAAAKAGFRYGETDVILASSCEVVAIHGSDNWMQSYFSGQTSRRSLQKMTLKQIKNHLMVDNLKVNTLDEILLALPNMNFFIDPKTNEVVLPLVKLIEKLGVQDRVCVGSFHYERVQTFINLLKDKPVSTSLIVGRGVRLRNKNLNMLKKGHLKLVEAVQLHHSLISEEMVELVQGQGLKALVWTANSPLPIKNAIKCGADGIISDHVELLKEVLQKNSAIAVPK
jgi:glycerophosphoryl diester phosphodiesterase